MGKDRFNFHAIVIEKPQIISKFGFEKCKRTCEK